MRIVYTFVLTTLILMGGITQSVVGDWYGDMDLGGPKLKMVMHFSDTLGYLQGSLDSPSQGAYGIEADTAYMEGDSLFINLSALGASYAAAVSTTAEEINGTFTQNGFNFPLTLTREEVVEEKTNLRPQDPRTIDYYEENVAFANFTDSVILAGTLTMPFDPVIKKVVILLSGSGPQNRNEEIGVYNHRPFLVLSDYLTKQGIAVLRYDDRGVGQSSGSYTGSTTEDFSRDAFAAVNFVKSRPDLEGATIGLIGHSEGGMIASMIADEVDYLVLLGTPGVPTPELLLSQSVLLSKAQGVPDTIIRLNQKLNARVYQHLLNYPDRSKDSLITSLAEIFKRSFLTFPESYIGEADIDQLSMSQASNVATEWFRYFIRFKPSVYLEKITKPVLAMTGTLDLQVPYSKNLPAIEESLKKAGNTQYEVFAFQGVNHLFQTAITGSTTEYGLITETFNEEAMATIAEWVNKL